MKRGLKDNSKFELLLIDNPALDEKRIESFNYFVLYPPQVTAGLDEKRIERLVP